MLERLNKVMNCKGKSLCSFFLCLLMLGLCWALVSKSVMISDGQPLVLCIVLAVVLALSIKAKQWWKVLGCVALLLSVYYFPSISFLWLVIGLVFCIETRTRFLAIIPLGLAILDEIGIVFTTRGALLLCFILLIVIAYVGRKYLKSILALGSGIFIIVTIFTMTQADGIAIEQSIVPNIYTAGDVTAYVAGSEVVGHSYKHPILRSPSFGSKIDSEQAGIVVFDIDQHEAHPLLTGEKWQQPTSWHDNLFLGNTYLLEAIARDGGLYSNKGMQLKDTCTALLALPQTMDEGQALIVKDKRTNIVYLHDSDYSSDYLANYQRHLLSELLMTSDLPYWKRGIQMACALLMIALLLGRYRKVQYGLLLIGVVGLVVGLYKSYLSPREGDIRLVGTIRNSHENARFDGVTKTLIHAGYNYTVGEQNSKLLIVQGGETAHIKTERIAVAEVGATVKTANHTLTVDEVPLHINDGIFDARAWIVDGRKTGKSVLVIDGCTYIATGSPAKVDWKNVLK